jgi:phenylalanyl-tRNA synthetase beta chain
MRFSEAWLREWVNPDVSTQELADQLSMAGLEVDSVEPAAAEFNGVVVGKVLTREQHPDADKLSVCSVDIGAEEPSQIVCGAKNVAAGMKVPVATLGARLSPDFKIKKTKLRGVQSLGMICSASELGLAESSDGIMPLPEDAPVGRDFRELMDLDDQCIEVDLTPDRGDCLSLAGIAREVGVINRSPLTIPQFQDVPAGIEDAFAAEVQAPAACPRYLCRVIRGIDPQAETPRWMVERLRRSGIRAISPVVDITNYVLIELGQPMHGFDLDRLTGKIIVRMAEQGEKLQLLDGGEVELRDDTLVIADAAGPLAMAGVMGGEPSGVTGATRDVLLEAAFFAPLAIAGKARSYGLHTDSSHRFERGVDYQLQRTAMQRATALMLEIVGGQAGPITEVVSEAHLPRREAISLRRERVGKVLGVQIDDALIEDILQRLGMQLTANAAGWDVVAPSARFDMAIEVDLIEEIGRIYGYANIPASLSHAPVSIVLQPENRFSLDRAKQTLVDRDYQEAITYSFISPELAALVTPGAERIELANPISADMSIMRASLLPGLLGTLQYNLARQQDRVRVFESGLTFERVEGELVQKDHLAAVVCGPVAVAQWGQAGRKVDFYDLKGDLEALLTQVVDLAEFRFVAAENPALHPGQSAQIQRNGAAIGWAGMLHPEIQAKLDLPSTYVFEVLLEGVMQGDIPAFEPLSKYPSIRRDLAVVLDRETPYAQVLEVARNAAPPVVRDIQLFDVYTGENVDSSLKSLALSLILQESSHTLTDREVDDASDAILDALASEFSAKLRD